MTNVGEMLRRERLRQGLQLDEVARDTKIRQKLLEFIEDDQFDRLPGGVFAKSFVKQYAAVLGLDGDELAAEVQRQIQPAAAEVPAAPKPEIEPVPVKETVAAAPAWETMGAAERHSSSPWAALALVVAVVVGCSFAYNWWTSSKTLPSSEQTAASAAREVPPLSQSVPTAAQREAAGTAEPPAAASRPDVPVLVTVTASEEAWVSARADGAQVFAATLAPNQSKTFEAQSGVRLLVGNAGGLSVTLNGKPVGEIGPRGQVRIVELNREGAAVQEKRAPAAQPTQDVL